MENEDYIKVTLTFGDEYDRVKNVFPGNFQIVTVRVDIIRSPTIIIDGFI